MAAQTYRISDSSNARYFNIQESAGGALALDDTKFYELVAYLQSEGVVGATGITLQVLRPEETLP